MNKKICLLLSILIFTCAVFAAQPEIVYISPNDDGVQDALVVPIRINDKRYISEWSFVITDEAGTVVKTIGNKDTRPETPGSVARSIFSKDFAKTIKRLFSPKSGVQIPESVMWNGTLDSGEKAADGTYKYYLVAKDDNNNESRTTPMTVVVDNTPPDITLVQPSEGAKIFGAGNKPTIKFEQSGSIEDLWEGYLTNVAGEKVRKYSWKNAEPITIEWDGKNDDASPVAEGVYTYKIEATDRAGNKSETAEVTNIIFDAIPRSVNMLVKDSPFSPNGDGIRDTLTIQPSMPNASGLVNWEISIVDKSDAVVRTFKGTTTPPTDIVYDGKNDAGLKLLDGDYQVKFKAQYNNGQEAEILRNIGIDSTAPSAILLADTDIFSPDGDGAKDVITISQEASKEKMWIGEILDTKGNTIKKWAFNDVPSPSLVWDGLTDKGVLAEDSHYVYKISATDAAGNTGSAETSQFQLDTSKTEIILTASLKEFSPNGDKVQDTVVLTPVTKKTSGIKEYTLNILDASGATIKTFAAKRSLPANFTWNGLKEDGTLASDGTYTGSLVTVSVNGSTTTTVTQPFVLDTVFPNVNAEATYLVFSPNGDGLKDELPVKITESTVEDLWTARFVNKANQTVREYNWKGEVTPFAWNGTDESGNILADGKYQFELTSQDAAGNKTEKVIKDITIDNRVVKTYLTAELNAFSPNGDNTKDTQKFSIMTTPKEGVVAWQFNIEDAETKAQVRSWSNADSTDLPATIVWDGLDKDGKVAEGKYVATLDLEYLKGDKVSVVSSSFISSVTPPQLTVKTAPDYFSPDNDGVDDDLFIALKGTSSVSFVKWSFDINDPQNGKQFWGTSGKKAITEKIIWDGFGKNNELVQSATDYPYVFTVTDEIGMTSTVKGFIPVDVLVIRDGNFLKMQVPSIIFRSDMADFVGKDKDPKNGLDKAKIENNERVLKRIADILNKFKDYKVTIEGHANNISGTEEEETSETLNGVKNIPLVPLSEARAAYVKEKLVEFGVSDSRLTTIGQGGRKPVVKRADKENWWKNRRVEFILNK